MSSEKVLPGLVLAGRYRVERQLGEGGMGSVFLVHHVHTDERLALKVLHEAVIEDAVAKERFQREARTPARIDSDHVVRVTDADIAAEIGGAPFLIMEYLRGQDLEQLTVARGALPPGDVVLYLRQAARALDKAHALGIIHRDLKPENLFLTEREDGTPLIKVLDFGIAKLTRSNDVAMKTATGQIFGTPMFMSPEQALAESAKISPQTDVWALGLIAHRLLTGKDLWSADNLTLLVAQIAFQPMPVPSEQGVAFGPAYDAWFARCCAREAAQRYASAGEAVTALAQALGVVEARSAGLGQRVVGAPGVAAHGETALAKTSQVTASGDALKYTTRPLTRSDLRVVGHVTPRRRLAFTLGALSLVAGGAAMAYLVMLRTTVPLRSVDDTSIPQGAGAERGTESTLGAFPGLDITPPALVPTEEASPHATAPRPGVRPARPAGSAKAGASASAEPPPEAPSAPAIAAPSASPSVKASAAPSAKAPAAPSASPAANPSAERLGGRR